MALELGSNTVWSAGRSIPAPHAAALAVMCCPALCVCEHAALLSACVREDVPLLCVCVCVCVCECCPSVCLCVCEDAPLLCVCECTHVQVHVYMRVMSV